MDDFEIELLDADEGENSAAQLPTNFITVGEVSPDDVKVYIKQDVYKALEKYARADVEHERGTIILGEYCEALGAINVMISNYIEAKYTDASASTLTFTHETWDYVHKQQDELYSDKKIVGWQHTHPSYGIFLSNYDLFIQENFFDLPFQVAYVIDPVQDLRGFFQWKNGKIEKLKGFYIYDEVGKPIKIEKKRIKKDEDKPKSSRTAVTVLSVITAASLICTGVMLVKYNRQLRTQHALEDRLQAQEETINRQDDTIKELDNKYNELLEESSYETHTVKYGETLAGICQKYGVDYRENEAEILSLNSISDPNLIYVGQQIKIPVKD